MTTMPKSFQNSQAIETGLSDFHKMCLTVLKVFLKQTKTTYKAIRNFQMKLFF